MHTVVFFEEFDAEYLPEEGRMRKLSDDADILTSTDTTEDALARIKEHQQINQGKCIQYCIQFWVDGDLLHYDYLDVYTPVEDHWKDIIALSRLQIH